MKFPIVFPTLRTKVIYSSAYAMASGVIAGKLLGAVHRCVSRFCLMPTRAIHNPNYATHGEYLKALDK